MNRELYPIHTPDTAPGEAQPLLQQTAASFGMIPNLEGVMANAPGLLKSYVTMWDEFDQTSLSPAERQVVYQTVNFENTCNYCVPWHTLLARKAGMAEADVAALREGARLSDDRLEALRLFARELVLQRGKVSRASLETFFAAGYTPQQSLEVVMGIAIKTMSNFTNSIAATPLDTAVAKLVWKKPLADEPTR